jgi:type I restriction enzyme S subunit
VKVPTTIRLGNVATVEREMIAPSDIRTGTMYVGLEHVESSGQFVGVREVTSGDLASTKFSFDSTHVLYGKLRPYLCKIARPTFAGVCTTEIVPIKPGPRLDRGFLFHFLRQPRMVEFATSRCSGANLPRLSPKTLVEFEIPLPPLSEQRRIAAVLDEADALRAKRRQALVTLDTLLQSVFLDMFGEPVTNPKGWAVKPLLSICSRVTDGTHLPPEWAVAGIPFLFVSNIVHGEIDFDTKKFISEQTHATLTARCPIERGDILYSTVGSYGSAVMVRTDRKFAFQRHIAHIKPMSELVDPEFLLGYLQSPWGRIQVDRAVRGVAQKTLNLADLKRFTVALPPIPKQKRYVQIRNAIELQRAELLRQADALGALFASLQSAAFSGTLLRDASRESVKAAKGTAVGAAALEGAPR